MHLNTTAAQLAKILAKKDDVDRILYVVAPATSRVDVENGKSKDVDVPAYVSSLAMQFNGGHVWIIPSPHMIKPDRAMTVEELLALYPEAEEVNGFSE